MNSDSLKFIKKHDILIQFSLKITVYNGCVYSNVGEYFGLMITISFLKVNRVYEQYSKSNILFDKIKLIKSFTEYIYFHE